MQVWPFNKLTSVIVNWLLKDLSPHEIPICDFDRIKYELKPCDVILIEGRSRVSEVIKISTKSSWSHAALYIGRLQDIENPKLRHKIIEHYAGDINEHLIIEGMLGKGTIVTPLNNYKLDHVRICRASALTYEDSRKVINYAINELGTPYDIKHVFDLLRLLFPITIVPHLFSSLFKPRSPKHKKQICSSLLAEAFASVKYPLIPKIIKQKDGSLEFIPRNPNLFTPRDFDYSPYFDIIKYPLYGLQSSAAYHNLPWNTDGVVSNDNEGLYIPPEKQLEEKSPKNDAE